MFVCLLTVVVLLLLQYLFTQYATQVIERHDPSTPLYLYLPLHLVHGPLQVGPGERKPHTLTSTSLSIWCTDHYR